MTIDGLADNFCNNCDERNGLYTATYATACNWAINIGSPPTNPFTRVEVNVLFSGGVYELTVTLSFGDAGSGCALSQTVFFKRNLGATKPTCLSDLAGDVPFLSSTLSGGGLCLTDPDCGCLIGGVTCTISY